MARARLPAQLQRRAATPLTPLRHQCRHASSFFNLQGLSNARETQHFSRITQLSRVEHSPPLKLIQTSEVDPFAPAASDVSGPKTPDGQTQAWTSLPDEAGREVGRGWSEEGRENGLVELAGERREKQRLAGGKEGRSGEVAGVSGATSPPASSGASDGRDGKKPREDDEPAVEKDHDIDEQEALKLGRTFLDVHAREKHKLQKELEEARRGVEDSRAAVERLEGRVWEKDREVQHLAHDEYSRRKAFAAQSEAVSWWRMFKAVTLVALGAWGYSKLSEVDDTNIRLQPLNNRASTLDAPGIEMETAKKQAEEKAREDVRHLRADHSHEIAFLRAEIKDATAQAKQNEDARRAIEAQTADWMDKARKLKQAVEKKDLRDLSKAEQNAYLEALVFLRVREKKERSWWRGLFWKEE